MTYQIHPLAEIFPRMVGEDFVSLKQDIKENGLREAIWLYDGKIIDGRNRYYACQDCGVTPTYREYTGSDPLAFVISLNLKRRHLTESQRAMVAASLANIERGQFVGNQHVASANLQTPLVSQSQAADMLQVSPRSVATAARVKEEGVPELIEAVQMGQVSVSAASIAATFPQEEQRQIVEEINQGAKPSEAIRAHVSHNSGNNEWYTPSKYIELARNVMGSIDTDPATSEIANKSVKATKYFTAEDDGRDKEWGGNVWMNPPYAQPLISDFAELISSKYEDDEISQACVLVNNATETQWFQRMLSASSAVCFPRSRIKFIDPNGNPSGAPLQGQAIIYFGENTESFLSAFSLEGTVLINV